MRLRIPLRVPIMNKQSKKLGARIWWRKLKSWIPFTKRLTQIRSWISNYLIKLPSHLWLNVHIYGVNANLHAIMLHVLYPHWYLGWMTTLNRLRWLWIAQPVAGHNADIAQLSLKRLKRVKEGQELLHWRVADGEYLDTCYVYSMSLAYPVRASTSHGCLLTSASNRHALKLQWLRVASKKITGQLLG